MTIALMGTPTEWLVRKYGGKVKIHSWRFQQIFTGEIEEEVVEEAKQLW